ncbi:MAG: phasin family protein [Arenimonas sp.]|uniref:phasin family protein n=1 Tax=Arenimonas sp. TaxID=1872635 RepID=UPI0025C3B674|nr:phasin family protein [Arenimonas sp.]MBW8368578.1 phasin family protein [Arenimonas sp.]
MAKLKKSVRAKSGASKPRTSKSNPDLQAKAEQMSRSLVESAQQIWMAGVGAFTRAQGEGSKLFEALVKEGMTIEQTTRKLATGKVDAVRDAVEDRVGVVRERAVDTWDRLETVFETRVQRALNRLGVPAREDLAELNARVNELNAELRKLGKAAPAKTARKPAAAKKAKPAKKAKVAKAPARKPAAKKAKAARKPALPKAPKPVAPQAG